MKAPHTRAAGTRPVNLTVVCLFLVLVAFLQISAPQASLEILWRAALLSFDNPATQLLDELAVEKTAFRDAFAELVASTRLAASCACRFLYVAPDAFALGELLWGCITRSPPVA